MHDLRPWLHRVLASLEAHRLSRPGAFARFRGGDAADPYGCADAANLRYSLAAFPRDPDERAACVRALGALQDPDTGLWREETHHPIHTTAHCVAALELFDAAPSHPLAALAHLEAPGALERFLDELDWRGDPWLAAHRGAGAYAARVLAGEASPEFEERYFAWLARECDPQTGLWRRGSLAPPYRWGTNRFPHLAGTFHYLFNLEWARRPHPHPAALVETCLELFATDEFPLATAVGFAEIDWAYCTARAHAQSGHRDAEVRAALARLADRLVTFLHDVDLDRDDGARDLHRLFGSICALAELQRVCPGRLRTRRPLRLVLDRRGFI